MIFQYILLLIAYLIGSIPFSIIFGKLIKGIDIRKHGSGNPGGTEHFPKRAGRYAGNRRKYP